MDPNEQVEDANPVANDTAEGSEFEDRTYDTLEDAAQALLAAETDDPEAETDEAEDDETDDEDVVSEDEADDDEAEEDVEDDPEVELTNGHKVPLSELTKGYMRQADYQRKTADVADQRKAVEAKASQVDAIGQAAYQQLQQAQTLVSQLAFPAPSYDLAQSNPAQYQQEMALYHESQKLMGQVQAQHQQMLQHQQRQMEQLKAQHRKDLIETLPHLASPEAMQTFQSSVAKTAAEYGFTEQEIASTTDPRILRMVADLGARKVKATTAKNAKRRVQRAKPVQGKPAVQSENKRTANLQRLRKSGSEEDAVKALLGQ